MYNKALNMGKYNFEKNEAGEFINPYTHLPFKYGDVFEEKRFERVDSKGKVRFYCPQKLEERNKKIYGGMRTLSGLASRLLIMARSRAKSKGGIVTITKQWVIEGIQQGYIVNGKKIGDFQLGCFTKKRSPWSASLDRIDSTNPNYTPENVQIVPWMLNCARSTYSDDDFLHILGPWCDYLRSKKESLELHSVESESVPETSNVPTV